MSRYTPLKGGVAPVFPPPVAIVFGVLDGGNSALVIGF